jgi:hypothetical protein
MLVDNWFRILTFLRDGLGLLGMIMDSNQVIWLMPLYDVRELLGRFDLSGSARFTYFPLHFAL